MNSKLSTLGFVLILSALVFSGCAPPTAQPTESLTVTEGEYCSDKSTGARLSYQEAVEIAQNSECLEQGQLKETRFCNEDTGTWWIDLDIGKPGCMPACVVHVSDKTVEINWRCTGVLPLEGAVEVPEGVQAVRDAALNYLSEHYGEETPDPSLVWTEENITPGWPEAPTPGWSEYRFTAEGWVVTIGHAVLPPEQIVYQVAVANRTTGFRWEGEVDAAGQVKETLAPADGQPVVGWYGYVAGTPDGAQFDDYLVLEPVGVGEVGLTGADASIEAEIEALRDKEEPGKYAHFWGALTCDVPDYGGCELVVSRLRPDGPGPFFAPDPVEGWEGTIYSGPPGPRSGGDDYFALVGNFHVQYGIGAIDEAINSQLESLRDTGTVIQVWGELSAGIPDWNGTQIQVSRIEVVEEPSAPTPPPPDWPESDDGMQVYTNDVYGYQFSYPASAAITEIGVEGFVSDELPEGMTSDEYMAQLREQYSDKLCVHIEYALGYIYISAPPNQGFRYANCGRTGVGAGEIVEKSETVVIAGQTYKAEGYEFTGAWEPCETLDCHNETSVIALEDSTRIEYGARPEPTASYEDYLTKGKEMLLQILASYETVPN
jgi:hypothetical protein